MYLSIMIKASHENTIHQGTVFTWEGARCILGRKEGDLRLVDKKCSRVHAMFYEDPAGTLRIRDLQSRNGIFINGKKTDDEVVVLGQDIRIGASCVRVLAHKSSQERSAEAERLLITGEIVGVGWPHQFTCVPRREQERLKPLIPEKHGGDTRP